ncbi:MAG: diguanylate cyclase [Anaerolineaceae bacterium]|nr:diguanylate cyclase [Anaerolineaceae bacterium]
MDKTIKEIGCRLQNLDKRLLFVIVFMIILGFGYLDYLTGFEYCVSIFYLFPIALAAWFLGRRSALFMSSLSGAALYVSNYFAGQNYSQIHIGYWNAIIHWAFFVIVSLLLVGIKKAIQRGEELSNTDPNTGLMNSRAFYKLTAGELARAKRYNRPYTIAYMDIDFFKQINDSLGHIEGDKVLKTVANTLRSRLRSTDLVARLGGDEFAALLPETDFTAGSLVIAKLQDHLLRAMKQHNWPVTFSIGAVTYYKFGISVMDVIKQVDQAMYAVKDSGRNNIHFDTVE